MRYLAIMIALAFFCAASVGFSAGCYVVGQKTQPPHGSITCHEDGGMTFSHIDVELNAVITADEFKHRLNYLCQRAFSQIRVSE